MYIIKPVDFTLSSITEPEDDAPLWASGTTYNIGDQVIRDHNVYASTINSNTGNDPALELQELEGARWLLVGATNIYRFFDKTLSTKTAGTSPLVIEVEAGASFNSLALFNLDCSTCKIEVITGTTTTLVATLNIGAEPVNNWWDWLNTVFFKNARRFIVDTAAGFSGSTVRLTIDGPSPALGELVIGRQIKLGDTEMNQSTSVRRKTFTSIDTNAFGITTAKKRAIARDVVYRIQTERFGFEAKERFLDDVDGLRVVTFALPSEWPQFINYGFITDYEIPASMPEHFIFEITTQGVS